MKNKRKNITTFIIILIILIAVGGVFAYLQDTDHKTNIFTLGRVKIELTESNFVEANAQDVRPGDEIAKDPKITNIGRNSAYVYMKVINPIVNLSSGEGPLFSYTVNSGWTQLSQVEDCNYRITTYYYNTALNPNTSTTTLFDTVTLNNYSNDSDPNQELNLYGYAIQSSYLASGSTITSIFSSHFSNNLSDTTITCPGMVPDYNGEGCANITNDSSGGGGNANMSGLTLMMKNASLGTDEDIDFSLPAGNWTDDNFSRSTSTGGPENTTTYYITYASSYTFNPKTGRYSLTNPSVGKYSDIYSTLPNKYIVSASGSRSSTGATSTDLSTIYKVTATSPNYTDNSFAGTTYSTRTMSETYQGYYYTYADSYTFDQTTGKFSLVNPSVGKYSDIYTTLAGKYIVSYIGSSSSSLDTSTNLSTIYKVRNTSTLTSLHYQASNKIDPLTYISSSTTQVAGDNGQGVYTRNGTENDTYPIYYYRGTLSLSNNLVFGGFCWKIVRTTATGGIRMIYNGVVNNDNSCGTAPGNTTERTHTQNHIKMTRGALNGDNYTYTQGTGQSTFQYNIPYRGYKYVGYMYETTEENDTDSNFKRVLDAWYSAYLTSYDNKIEDSIYCNDRTYTTINNQEYYCPRTRAQNSIPSTLCSRKTDAFGVNNGNKKSTYKVGFITVDEEMLAGRSWNYGMKDYLYSSNNYWTGSPMVSSSTININERKAFVFYIVFDSYLNYSYYLDVDIANAGVRPVISLKVNTSYTGTGSLTDPFIVN